MKTIYFKLFISAFFWGGSSIAAKILMETTSPSIATILRFFGATIALFFLVKVPNRKVIVTLKEHVSLAISGIVGITFCYYFYFEGLNLSSTFNAALFEAATPLLTFLIALFLRKEKFEKFQFLGLIIAYCGVFVIVAQGSIHNIIQFNFSAGDILLLLSTVCFAIYNILCRNISTSLPVTIETYYIFLYGSIGLFPWLLFKKIGNDKLYWDISIVNIVCVIFLALGSSAIAYLFFNEGIKELGASKASKCINLVPVIAMVLTLIVLKDIPTLYQVIGAIIILTGIYVSQKKRVL